MKKFYHRHFSFICAISDDLWNMICSGHKEDIALDYLQEGWFFREEVCMIEDKQWNRLLRGHTPGICTTCNKPLKYVGSGRYQCPICGAVLLDDFGKIKEYLSVNGPTPAWKLARELGIRRDVIEQYIKDGSVAMIQNELKDKRL